MWSAGLTRRGRARPGRPSPRTHRALWWGHGQGGLFPASGHAAARGRQRGALVVGQGGLETGLFCGSVRGGHTRHMNIQYIEPAGGLCGDLRAPAACLRRFRGGCRGRASPPAPGSQGCGRRRGAVERWSPCAHVDALLLGQGLCRRREEGRLLPSRWCRSSGPEGLPAAGDDSGARRGHWPVMRHCVGVPAAGGPVSQARRGGSRASVARLWWGSPRTGPAGRCLGGRQGGRCAVSWQGPAGGPGWRSGTARCCTAPACGGPGGQGGTGLCGPVEAAAPWAASCAAAPWARRGRGVATRASLARGGGGCPLAAGASVELRLSMACP